MVSVFKSQCLLQLAATHLPGERRHQLHDMTGHLRGVMFGDQPDISSGTLYGRRVARGFMYRKTDEEPSAVVVALEDRGR